MLNDIKEIMPKTILYHQMEFIMKTDISFKKWLHERDRAGLFNNAGDPLFQLLRFDCSVVLFRLRIGWGNPIVKYDSIRISGMCPIACPKDKGKN